MILIVTVLLGSIALIVFALIYKAKKNTQKQRLRFEEQIAAVAQQNHLDWTVSDIGRNRALAWSAGKRLLFFMDFPDEQGRKHLIDMDHVEHCSITEEFTAVSNGKGKPVEKHISGIKLEIRFKDKTPVYLPLYSEADDGVLERARLSGKAAYWLKLIRGEA